MLLLILFAGCLASCAAQTMSTSPFPTSAMETPTTSAMETSTTSAMETSTTSAMETSTTSAMETPTTSAMETSTTSAMETPTTSAMETPTTSAMETPTTSAMETLTTSAMEMLTVTPTPFTQSVQATSVLLTSDSDDVLENVMAILLAAVQSYQELNETNIAPVLTKLSNMIEQLQPDMNFSLTLKNITRV